MSALAIVVLSFWFLALVFAGLLFEGALRKGERERRLTLFDIEKVDASRARRRVIKRRRSL